MLRVLFLGAVLGAIFTAAMLQGTNDFPEDGQNFPAWDNPSIVFDAREKVTSVSKVRWVTAEHPLDACRKQESENNRIYGTNNTGFAESQQIHACAFFREDDCLIITGADTTMHTFGHEIRHCFQGHWH